MNENPVVVENGNDPARIARIKARRERAQRNRDWLDAHLAELLPKAYGKLVAVAGREAYIAETEEEAGAWARAAHPEDDGLVIRVMPLEHMLSPNEHLATLEIATDPEEIALSRAQDERFKRNSDWLQAHWADLLPQALGKHLVVAGQEAFVADTSEEARAMAKAAHPDDDGAFCQYVLPIEGLVSMRIVGEWLVCNDGVTRPAVRAKVQAVDGSLQEGAFLIDSCADRTVLGADLMETLGFPMTPAPEDLTLKGITGECGFVVARTIIELPRDDGGVAAMRGEFAAFTDASATEISILGREVLDLFDVIPSRRRDEVLLLTQNHSYRVVSA